MLRPKTNSPSETSRKIIIVSKTLLQILLISVKKQECSSVVSLNCAVSFEIKLIRWPYVCHVFTASSLFKRLKIRRWSIYCTKSTWYLLTFSKWISELLKAFTVKFSSSMQFKISPLPDIWFSMKLRLQSRWNSIFKWNFCSKAIHLKFIQISKSSWNESKTNVFTQRKSNNLILFVN